MADFDSQRQKAFDFCADATKQLVTLSTAIIAFMVTFAKDFVISVSDDAKWYAYIAWGLHLFSVLFGITVLLALTAQLEPKNPSTTGQAQVPTIRGSAATYSGFQIVAFLLAMLFTIIFGIKAAQSKAATTPTQTTVETQKSVTGGAGPTPGAPEHSQ